MTTTGAGHEPKDDKFAREVIGKELTYRCEKQWRIFSWTSTFLLAAIGGVVVLTGKGQFKFCWPLRVVMAGALIIIAAYACSWIGKNIKFEHRARLEAMKVDSRLEIKHKIPERGSWWGGYRGALTRLAIAAVLAVLFSSE